MFLGRLTDIEPIPHHLNFKRFLMETEAYEFQFMALEEKPSLEVKILRKSSQVPHHKVVNGHDRYYYDAEVNGKTQILSVGSKAQEVIEKHWPAQQEFVLTNFRSGTVCRPKE